MLRITKIKAFTLIELVVILAIIVILAVIAIPSFQTLVQNYRIKGTSENLYYMLQYARGEAIKRNANVYVKFTTGDNWCFGANAGATCDCTVSGSCALGVRSALSTGKTTLSTTLSSNQVYFEGSQGRANNSGTVTITAYGASSPLITISISQLGNLQMCATGISGYASC